MQSTALAFSNSLEERYAWVDRVVDSAEVVASAGSVEVLDRVAATSLEGSEVDRTLAAGAVEDRSGEVPLAATAEVTMEVEAGILSEGFSWGTCSATRTTLGDQAANTVVAATITMVV